MEACITSASVAVYRQVKAFFITFFQRFVAIPSLMKTYLGIIFACAAHKFRIAGGWLVNKVVSIFIYPLCQSVAISSKATVIEYHLVIV